MGEVLFYEGIQVGSKEMFSRINKAIEINNLRPVIGKIYPFEQAKEALSSLEESVHFGKIALSF